MKDLSYYADGPARPAKAAYTETFWYKRGAVFAKRMGMGLIYTGPGFLVEAEAGTLKGLVMEQVVTDAYAEAVTAWRGEMNRLSDEFKADALADAGLTDDPAADVIYAKAYENGHPAGYNEILNELGMLTDFLTAIDTARAAK